MTTATVTKIVQQTVVIVRDGERITPRIGQPYKFTAAEIKSIESQSADALRDPKNEDPDGLSAADAKDPLTAGQGGSKVEAGQTGDATKGKNTGGNSGDGKSEGEAGKQKASAADGKPANGDKLEEGL